MRSDSGPAVRGWALAARDPLAEGGSPGLPAAEEDGAAEAEIDAEFQRKLAGLRRMPKPQRASALRAARECRASALRVLREKRARARRARLAARTNLRRPAA